MQIPRSRLMGFGSLCSFGVWDLEMFIPGLRANVMALRYFEGCSNLAPASWSAAVPSAVVDPRARQIPKSARKDRRTPKASPFRDIIDDSSPHRLRAESFSENLGDIHRHGAGRVAPQRYRTTNPFAAAPSNRCSS